MRDISKLGKTALIRYTGGIQGEEPTDRTGAEPMAVVLGAGRLPIGVENALHEMAVGEERDIVVPPELGFGMYNKEGVQWYPRAMIDRGDELHTGDVISWVDRVLNQTFPAYVTDENDGMIQIDINHPFAGKTLAYHLELVELRD
jgi:FKBP-type peptidyl-prolyl cis-trans isomerase 2